MNLISTFLDVAERASDRAAVIEGSGRRISYGALAKRSAALAARWRGKGVGRGDRVLVAMGVGIELYATIAALWRLGATVVFPEPAFGRAGLAHALAATRPKAFVAAGLYRALPALVPGLWRVQLWLSPNGAGSGEPLEDVNADHPALISFTTGSTGAPKGIVRSHGFLRAQDAALHDLLAADDATDLVAFPVFVIVNLGLGVTSVLPPWPPRRPEKAEAGATADIVAHENVTRLLVPPSICETLADAPRLDIAQIFTGGGPVFPDLLERLAECAPAARLTAVYGSTEAEPIAHIHADEIAAADWRAMREGAGLLAGPPVPQTALRIVDGEVVVTGDHVNKTYLDPSRDAENKLRIDGAIWHRTGDAGRVDEHDRLWLLGRHGEDVDGLHPFPVEVAARAWPGVRRAAFLHHHGRAVVALEGREPTAGDWSRRASRLGALEAIAVERIPLDPRHASKTDRTRLRKLLDAR